MSKINPIVSEFTKQPPLFQKHNSASNLIHKTLIKIFPNHFIIIPQSLALITPGKITQTLTLILFHHFLSIFKSAKLNKSQIIISSLSKINPTFYRSYI